MSHNDPATLMSDAMRFLFEGPDAIQTGVDAGAIDPQPQAVIRAKVTDRSATGSRACA